MIKLAENFKNGVVFPVVPSYTVLVFFVLRPFIQEYESGEVAFYVTEIRR